MENIEMNIAKWSMGLRNNDFPGIRQVQINGGTPMRPEWFTMIRKFPKVEEFTRENGNEKDDCSFNFEKMKYRNREFVKEAKKHSDYLKGIKIEGKSLLQSEMDNFKLLKGKKFINRFYFKDEEVYNKEIFKSSSTKDLLCPNIINSCMKLHLL